MPWREIIERNRTWAAKQVARDPQSFARAVVEQNPHAFYIGCSDSRVPANVVTNTGIGEMFVHRNVANQVNPSDASFQASLQYAVEVLGVDDVIVCGHLGCGGCAAALGGEAPDAVEAWIAPLRLVARVHAAELDSLQPEVRAAHLVELNVMEQVRTLARHPVVRRAWARGNELTLHGWVYDMVHGHLHPRIRIERGEDGRPTELLDAPVVDVRARG